MYDFEKAPSTEVVNQMEEKAYYSYTANEENLSPVDNVLKKSGALRYHLQENYDYAKKVESAID